MSDQQFVNNINAGAGAGPPLGPRNPPGAVNQMNARPTMTAALNGQNNAAFPSIGDIQHVANLSEHIGQLYLNEDYSDIELIVDTTTFHAHKVILAVRSEYFRALLYGGMRETSQRRVELVDTNVLAFKMLLRYIYMGRVTLTNLKEDLILDVLGLAHKYGFAELETATSEYLKAILNARNLCTIFGASHLYSLTSLTTYCLEYADKHASDVLSSDGFLGLSSAAVDQLLSRDSFCAPEIDIFKAVREWTQVNVDADTSECEMLVAHVRLPLMKLDELLNIVRPSMLIQPDRLLDAIKEQSEKRDMDLHYRGCLMPSVNVATQAQGAQVVDGELKQVGVVRCSKCAHTQALLNGDTVNYDMERGFTRHPIEDTSEGIIVQLGVQSIVNHIRLLLWDKDARSYSYYVELAEIIFYAQSCQVSAVDICANTNCRYIRVVGTHNTVNRVFHLVALEAYYVQHNNRVDDLTGLIIPCDNVATIENSAVVIEGVSRSRNALLNGDTDNYDWDSGYTCHQLGSGAIVVQLAQPYLINSMSLLLWDCDERAYSYYIEVSTDQTTWRRVVDKTRIACQGWQTLRWQERVAVTFIRIVGTQNTANEVFHCVHFECPARSVPPARHQKGGQTTAAEMADDQPSTSQLLQQDVVVVPTLEVTAVVTPLRESNPPVDPQMPNPSVDHGANSTGATGDTEAQPAPPPIRQPTVDSLPSMDDASVSTNYDDHNNMPQ